MDLSGTIRALRGIGAGWLALAAGGGIAVGVGICLVLVVLLPVQLAQSLLPHTAGVAAGLLCCLAIGSIRDRALKRPLVLALVATLIAAGYLGLLLAVVPDGLSKRRFGYWSPSLGGLALAVWVATALWERRAGKRLAAFTAIIAGLALAAMLLNNGRPVFRALSGEYVRSWNVYHYYVGSKYFAELGYTDLYAATLLADDEWRERERRPSAFSHIQKTRDMRTYLRVPRAKAVAGYERSAFSDERWEQLGEDTRALRPYLGDESWKGVLTDLGFNPSPAWTVLGTPVANLASIDGPGSWLIANSDLPLLIGIFGFVWWAFGPRAAFMALLWLNLIHFNRARFAGGFFQYDWLASMVIGFALYHKGRARVAGAVFSWGVMTRVFPAFLVIPLAIKLVVDLARGPRDKGPIGRLDPRRLRFIAALALSCAVIFGLSHLTGRGLDSWPEWVDKIGRHSHLHPVMDPQRIGVGRLVLHEPTDEDPWAPASGAWERRLEESRPLKWAIQAVGLLLLAAAAIRRRDEDAMVMMLFGVFLILTLSRYYASSWVLLLFLQARPGPLGPARWAPVLCGAFMCAMAAVFFTVGTRAGRYFLVNYEAAAMFFALGAAFVVSTWRRRRRAGPDGPGPP